MSLSIQHPSAPGAYLQRYDQAPPAIPSLRTDIAGFAGIAERGPLGVPVAVESFREFQAIFGDYTGSGFLAYSVRAFFENGGRRARVVRVASEDPVLGAACAKCTIPVLGGGAGWEIIASSPGVWGNAISVAVIERNAAQTEADLSRSTPGVAAVASTAGFAANSLVRLSQPGSPAQIRVIAGTDPAMRLLYWIGPDPDRRGGRQSPVTGFDPNRALLVESVTYDLLVFSKGQLASVTQGLSLVPEAPAFAALLLQPIDFSRSRPPGALPLVSMIAPEIAADAIPGPLDVTGMMLPLTGGRDGLAALVADDFIGDPLGTVYDGRGVPIRRGLSSLACAADVAMIAVPDILIRPVAPPIFTVPPASVDECSLCPPEPAPAVPASPVIIGEIPPVFSDAAILAVQTAMIEQCEASGTRVALLDPPWTAASGSGPGAGAIQEWRDNFDSEFGCLYFPWLTVSDPLRLAPIRAVPPSGHIAGLIAATDLAAGVHKAPANADLSWALDVTVPVDVPTHGLLNTAGINVIRGDLGRPLRVLGARTVSSAPAFRFLNVRRLLCMVRKALDLSTRWAVFEPNNTQTRAALAASIGGFLRQLWTQGALAGTSPAAAFYVICDGSNNPEARQALGELFVDVGLAPSIPFEFVLLRLGRSSDSLDIEERGTIAAGNG
jgi:hypothetical protein